MFSYNCVLDPLDDLPVFFVVSIWGCCVGTWNIHTRLYSLTLLKIKH